MVVATLLDVQGFDFRITRPGSLYGPRGCGNPQARGFALVFPIQAHLAAVVPATAFLEINVFVE